MSRLSRNVLCTWVGAIFGNLGGALVLDLLAALVSLTLTGSSRGEENVGFAFFAFLLLFALLAVPSFLLCRKLTRKYVRADYDSTGKVLFR